MTALTDCFRSEAGAAGRDTRGMLRQHQFRKVELVSIAHPDDERRRARAHDRAAPRRCWSGSDCPTAACVLCAGDTGFGAAKTFDLEVWLPGQQSLARDQLLLQLRATSRRAG